MCSIRILIADDHPIVRDGLRKVLSLEHDFDVVGEAADGLEVLDKIQTLDPDVLLLDLRMPHLDGLTTLRQMARINKRTRVIVLTASEDQHEFVQAMKLGCSGIIFKQMAPEVIVNCIRKMQGGVARQFAPQLTPREREIIQLVAQGHRNKDMAATLFISEQTVKNHLHNIFEKLGVSDRLELALYAVHKGLLGNSSPHI
jgi:DNA-binding NarL/FixJ family response regulator